MRSLVPLSLVLLVLSACKGSPTEPRFDDAALAGRIVFAETGEPVAGARVRISQSHPFSGSGETFSIADGSYRLTDLPGGPYAVSVYLPGASLGDTSFFRTIDLANGVTTFLDVQLSANRCVTLTGTVIDRGTRLPISGATLRFGDQSAMTGGDGMYTLSIGCPPPDAGSNRLWSVTHPRYKPREFQMRVPTYSTIWDVPLDPL